MKFLFALILSSSTLHAQIGDYAIDDHYKAGNNLIYECARKHYVCVNNDGWEKCTAAREYSIERKEKVYLCAPLKKYDEKTKCVVKNYQVVEKNVWKRFCFPK